MKKILPFCIIVLTLALLTLGSQQQINHIFTHLEEQLSATEALLTENNFEEALPSAAACIDYFDSNERLLCFFMPSETLHLFEASIYGMRTYIEEENRTEALAEAARAHAQLNAVWTMYFRTI